MSVVTTSSSSTTLSTTTILLKQIINNTYLFKCIIQQVHKIHLELGRRRIFRYSELNARWLINKRLYHIFDEKIRNDPHFYLSRDEVILFMADNTSLDRFKRVLEHDPRAIYSTGLLMDRAVSTGSLDIVKYIFNDILPSQPYQLWIKKSTAYLKDLTSKANEVHTRKPQNFIDIGPSTIASAANSGYFEMVEYLVENIKLDNGCSSLAYYMCAKGGYLDILKYLLEYYKPKFEKNDTAPNTLSVVDLYEHACHAAKLSLLEYLVASVPQPPNMWRMVASSISSQNIALASDQPPNNHLDYSMDSAVRTGSMTIVQLVFNIIRRVLPEFIIPHSASTVSASKGMFDILNYLVDNGCQLSDNAMALAAEHGHEEIVRYLHQRIQPFNMSMLVDGAAAHGSLAIVKFLTESGYSASPLALNSAATHGHLSVVMTEGATQQAFNWASGNNRLAVLDFLHKRHTRLCLQTPSRTIADLMSDDALQGAVRSGHKQTSQYILDHFRHECNLIDCTMIAFSNGNFHIMDLIDHNNPLIIFSNHQQQKKININTIESNNNNNGIDNNNNNNNNNKRNRKKKKDYCQNLNHFFEWINSIQYFKEHHAETVDDCCCEITMIDKANLDLNSVLNQVVKTRFFKYFRVNLFAECPFWVVTTLCGMDGGCGVCECDDNEIPLPWRIEDHSSDRVNLSPPPQGFTRWKDRKEDMWVIPYGPDSDTSYVNLDDTPESFTGYDGSSVWRSIYNENCFTIIDCKTNRLYFLLTNKNRAVGKIGPFLTDYKFNTGHEVDDGTTYALVQQLLKTNLLCNPSFDETLLFKDTYDKENLITQFKGHFQNISSILNCVTCEKCKLYGKMQTLGLGTALKILFDEDQSSLQRNEIIALINTLRQLSNSITFIKELTKNSDFDVHRHYHPNGDSQISEFKQKENEVTKQEEEEEEETISKNLGPTSPSWSQILLKNKYIKQSYLWIVDKTGQMTRSQIILLALMTVMSIALIVNPLPKPPKKKKQKSKQNNNNNNNNINNNNDNINDDHDNSHRKNNNNNNNNNYHQLRESRSITTMSIKAATNTNNTNNKQFWEEEEEKANDETYKTAIKTTNFIDDDGASFANNSKSHVVGWDNQGDLTSGWGIDPFERKKSQSLGLDYQEDNSNAIAHHQQQQQQQVVQQQQQATYRLPPSNKAHLKLSELLLEMKEEEENFPAEQIATQNAADNEEKDTHEETLSAPLKIQAKQTAPTFYQPLTSKNIATKTESTSSINNNNNNTNTTTASGAATKKKSASAPISHEKKKALLHTNQYSNLKFDDDDHEEKVKASTSSAVTTQSSQQKKKNDKSTPKQSTPTPTPTPVPAPAPAQTKQQPKPQAEPSKQKDTKPQQSTATASKQQKEKTPVAPVPTPKAQATPVVEPAKKNEQPEIKKKKTSKPATTATATTTQTSNNKKKSSSSKQIQQSSSSSSSTKTVVAIVAVLLVLALAFKFNDIISLVQ
ncbi:hypothetical protein DFA_11080 [Cavenderia fasciculata]|uniref:Ankyrin repeat-containing protein n=1 Tax=Cavenderia fasciculata TaxID=261658 RepID=F4QEQ8_CACFS|nr:uncharacterized protein DFA_11080 [Cavenderia fasciculata]EGG13319.1 hypothetical protein DFA_11080 [Cavenderia fasciculata]|eukprot:XP_004350018.1 hypothetical protein DFA_11080 [Cavenderia fasciculata]